MTQSIDRRQLLALMGYGAVALAAGAGPALAESAGKPRRRNHKPETYSSEEILLEGHKFFGKATRGLGEAVEYAFSNQGEPTAYIVGEEAAGALVGGLRYGEGIIYYKSGIRQKIYWQGPSLGLDVGGNGSRALVLVYNSSDPRDIYGIRFGGVEGSAYLVGGVGVNFQKNEDVILAPIRTGVGARLGANVGYLKYSRKPSWNPF
ncbi:MAG: DUF1134 domain-containing protein [Parvibaculaceae bacterium]